MTEFYYNGPFWQSLEDEVVSETILTLASLQTWHSLSYGRFQVRLPLFNMSVFIAIGITCDWISSWVCDFLFSSVDGALFEHRFNQEMEENAKEGGQGSGKERRAF